MEIPRLWRLGKSSKILSGEKTTDQRKLQRLMVEAGGRDGTADEALIKFYSYVAKQENWGPHSIADHPFLNLFKEAIDVTKELTNLRVEVDVVE